MSSYQEIESRLKTVEDMLGFVMTSMRMKGMISNGLLGPDGQPTGKILEETLLGWYRIVKASQIDTVKHAKIADVVDEKEIQDPVATVPEAN